MINFVSIRRTACGSGRSQRRRVRQSRRWSESSRPVFPQTQRLSAVIGDQFTSQLNMSSSTAANAESARTEVDCVLPYVANRHNSIKIVIPEDGDDRVYDQSAFGAKLRATVAASRQLKHSAVWVEVPISRASLIEQAATCGFTFHQAEGSTALLSKWLEESESRIPTYATHQVGVGAVVINSRTDEILCVREKSNNYRPWKMPGGLAELGEHLDEAVVREVKEETGIDARFESVLGVRHTHGLQFGRSDLYFVCRLTPILDENGLTPQPVPQESEIEAVSWQPVASYRAMVNSEDPKVRHPMMQQIMKLVDQGETNDVQRTVISSVVPGRKSSPLYHAPIEKTGR